MGIILLEALLALALLLFIVWWTMFAGRKRGELPTPPPSGKQGPSAAAGPTAPSPPTHSPQPPHEPPQ